MTDLHDQLDQMRRPRLLIRTARFGLADYRRTRALRRLLAAANATTPEEVVATLLRHEARAEACRQAGEASYSIARHVELLIALMAEARHLPRPRPVHRSNPAPDPGAKPWQAGGTARGQPARKHHVPDSGLPASPVPCAELPF